MLSKIYTIMIIITLLLFNSYPVFAQTGQITFTGGSGNGSTVTSETVSTAFVTVSGSNDIFLADWTTFGVGTMTGDVAVCNGETTSMTLTFNKTVNITTIECADNNDPGFNDTNDWLFTPNTGSALVREVDGNNGTVVTLNFVGITSIVITINGGGTDAFAVDNINMDASLPVELTSFYSVLTLNSVKLKWETATEVNNYGFEVERKEIGESSKEMEWQKIGFVEGHGNSNSPKKYIFEDKTYAAGKVYKYRLKQIDFDGAFEHSDELVVETTVPEKAELAQNYPNPFNPGTTIKFSMPEADFAKLTVYNSIGQEVSVLINENLEPGFYTYLFDGSKLASGTYIYKLETAGRLITKKMLLIK